MTTARFTWKLLFQSGLLNQQELHLPQGEVTVGSGSEWDIDMLGAMHSAQEGSSGHIELSVSEDSVLLRPIDMRCTVDGQAVKSEQITLQAGQTVEVGGCTFILGRVGEERARSAIDAFDIDALDADDQSLETAFSNKHQFGFGKQSADNVDEGESVEEVAGHYPKKAAGKGRWLRVFGVAVPGSLAAGIVFALAYAGQELRASVVSPSEPFSFERYQASLAKTGLSTVQIERDKSGTVRLSGSCWKADTLQPFLHRLTESGTAYRNEVLCQDDLQRSVGYILQANGYHTVRVSSGARLGEVVIAGNIRADARWQKVTQQLNKLQGLLEWTVHNDTETSLSDLIVVLRDRGLLSKLSLSRQDDVLTVTGQLDEAQQQTLKEILRPYELPQLRAEQSSALDAIDKAPELAEKPIRQRAPLRIIYQNIPALKQEASIFPAAIVSFSGNQQTAALQLANGMTVQAGSALPSGYTITRLDESGIELQKEGQLVHFPLGL